MGYLESETDPATGNRQFYKVNPTNQQRTPRFDKGTEARLIQEYNQLTGKSETGLPFSDFDYLPDNSNIRFRVQNVGEFVYWFKEREMLKLIEPDSELAGWKPNRSSRRLYTGSYEYKLRVAIPIA